MLKNSPEQVLDLILDFINLCLDKSIVSKNLCPDLIQPIFKSGNKNDPNNYRGICLSSSILKLITSLIYQRLVIKVDELNLISKNQIGFRTKSRTSDHLLTIKNIAKKCVTIGQKKLYLCFIDFENAFDSIWHGGLFHKLHDLGLNGKLLDLIENIYVKTKCAVKHGGKLTQFFNFSKGVRQGCPLSPLLFNVYINEIFQIIDLNTKTHITLNGIDNVNALMYADDLVIIGESQNVLQEKLNKLNEFCDSWGLKMNTLKTKCMVFNRGNRLCNLNIHVKGKNIENVKSFKYLGFTIGAKNCSFTNTPIDLSIKAKRAIFALNNKIKLSFLPIRLALKIFMSQISPILLYGSEIWGPYLESEYSSWDKSETEKVFTQYLKRILGCSIQTPNLMVRSELGTRPLLCNIIRRSIFYIKSVEGNDETLANQALEIETDLQDERNILSLIRKYTPFYQEEHNFLTPKNKMTVRKLISQNYDNIWKHDINLSTKASSFLSYKLNNGLEKYTWSIKNKKHRTSLSRLRLSSHQLMIEKGRHHKPIIPRTDRICPLCNNGVEDECHFITTCPIYQADRKELFDVAENLTKFFKTIPSNNQKFIYLMSNEDPILLAKLGEFTYKSFKTRNDHLGTI